MTVNILQHRCKPGCGRLGLHHLMQQPVKEAEYLQLLITGKEACADGIKFRKAPVGILQRQHKKTVCGETDAVEIDQRKQSGLITAKGIFTALGQDHRIARVGDIANTVVGIGDLSADAKGQAKVPATVHLVKTPLVGMYCKWLIDICYDKILVFHVYHPW